MASSFREAEDAAAVAVADADDDNNARSSSSLSTLDEKGEADILGLFDDFFDISIMNAESSEEI